MAYYKAPTANYKSTTLNGAIDAVVTTITLTSASGFQSPGYIVINREDGAGNATPGAREVVSYTGISGNDLTGCTRGADNSTARSHVNGSLVEAVFTVGMWSDLRNPVATALSADGTSVTSTGTLSVGGAITQTGAAAHIVLTPGANKLVKIAVLRQDNTTNTYTSNSVILTGWGFIRGDGTNGLLGKTVTYGITFSAAPIILISSCGSLAGSDPTTIGDFTGNDDQQIRFTISITTTTFVAKIRHVETGSATDATHRIGYAWVAIGTLS